MIGSAVDDVGAGSFKTAREKQRKTSTENWKSSRHASCRISASFFPPFFESFFILFFWRLEPSFEEDAPALLFEEFEAPPESDSSLLALACPWATALRCGML